MLERRKRLPDGSFSEPQKVGQGETLREKAERLEMENLTNMLAMADMFESNIKLQQENTQLMLAITDLYETIIGGVQYGSNLRNFNQTWVKNNR